MEKATAEQMRRIEQMAVEQGADYTALMETAGSSCAQWLLEQADAAGRHIVIVCGRGNNGGDGLVMARYLRRKAPVTVVLVQGIPTAHPAREMYDRLDAETSVSNYPFNILDWTQEPYLCRAAVGQADILVDAIYGIGFHGQLREDFRPLMGLMRESGAHKVAVDMPSGLPSDGSPADEDAFLADDTLTFTAQKVGQDHPSCGQIAVLDIGIPASVVERVMGRHTITSELVDSCFRPRPLDTHKGTFGRLLTVCGSYGMAGAAQLCARGALRSGVGLLTAAVPQSIYPILAPVVPEAVYLPLPETHVGQLAEEAIEQVCQAVSGATAVVIGCGLGTGEVQTRLVEQICRTSTRPVILDADGINAIGSHILTEEAVSAPLILTPHPGEMARLLDLPTAKVQQHRAEIARRFADEYGVTLVLKGHNTLVTAPGRPVMQNTTGNPGMATGGSGDVLAGIIGSLAAQGMDPYYAAVCGVYIHGAAGDLAAERLSQHSMLPSDLIEELGNLFLQFEK